MKLTRISVPLALVVATTTATASDWEVAASSEGGTIVVSVDRDSIRTISPGKRRAWSEWWYDQDVPVRDTPNKRYKTAKNLVVYNCTEGSYQLIQQTLYDKDGTDVASASQPNAREYIPPPDSLGEIVLNYVCKLPARRK